MMSLSLRWSRRRLAAMLWAVGVLLLFSGCIAPPWSAAGPRSYAPDDGRPVIVCLGDSITAGDAAPVSQSYPAWLQRRLNAAGYRYRVVNAGVSGDRVADGAARLQRDVLHFHPAITVVALGSNDAGHTPPEQWEHGLLRIVATLQHSGSRVVIGGLDEPGLNDVYRAVATARGTPLVWLTAGLWSRPGLWGDAHHPDGAGYRVVMGNVWAALRPMLRRR